MSTYTQLLSDVAAWTARSDLTPVIPSFLQLAEDKIDRQVRVAEMRDTVRKTFTASTPSVPLPFRVRGRFLEPHVVRSVNADGGTICTYSMAPEKVFRDIARQKSGETIFTVDEIPRNFEVTVFDGATEQLVIPPPEVSTLTDTWTVVFGFVTNTPGSGDQYILGSDGIPGLQFFVDDTTADLVVNVVSGGTAVITSALSSFTTSRCVISYDGTNLDITINGTTTTVAAALGNVQFNAETSIGGQAGADFFDGQIYGIGLLSGTALDSASAYRRFFDIDGALTLGDEGGLFGFEQEADFWYADGGSSELYALNGVNISPSISSTVDNQVVLLVNPALGEDIELEMSYYQGFAELGSTSVNNWLINKHYDIYLYGTLAEAYDYLQNPDQELRYREKFAGAIKSLNDANLRKLQGTGPYKRRHTGRRTP